jgi:NTP pyrophosphatase (non-canonical NTP hydrolase)
MDYQQYIENCLKTEAPYSFDNINDVSPRLLHGAMGLVTESSELLDAIKKSVFYNKELDRVNIVEELGDLLWYVSLLMKEMNVTYDEVTTINIDKLKLRYPNKFTENNANNRNIDDERQLLEKLTEKSID